MKQIFLSKLFNWVLLVVSVVLLGIAVQSCSNDSDMNEIDKSGFETYLSISKSDFDFVRDWDNLSEADKTVFKLAKKRMNITFEKNGICQTRWMLSSQVNMSDELFDWFINMIDITNRATEELNRIEWAPSEIYPRLKSGTEGSRTDNCVVQSLFYVLQNFGVYSGPYGLSSIDNWIYTNNYYQYSSEYGWGAYYSPILSHYLEGSVIDRAQADYISALSNLGSSQSIIILSGQPTHAVVVDSYNPPLIHYYDPQNNCYGDCSIGDIIYMYRATYFNHY
jgi:hypothetical protein